MEAFNKVLENTLTKVCNLARDDWGHHVFSMLWAYQTTCKHLTNHTSFQLVYGKEAATPVEFIVPSLCIALLTHMTEKNALQCRLDELISLEKDWLLVGYNQLAQKL